MKKNSIPTPRSLSLNQIATRALIALAILLLFAGLAFLVTDAYFYSQSPEPSEQSNAHLKEPAGSRSKNVNSEEPGNDVNLTFYERLSSNRTYPTKSPSAPKSVSQQRLSPEPVQEQKVEVAPPESGTPQEPAEDRTETAYYAVQVGSFQNLESAQTLLQDLKGKGFSPSITPVHFPEGATWYRVRVGSSLLRSEAEKVARELRNKGEFQPLVVTVK